MYNVLYLTAHLPSLCPALVLYIHYIIYPSINLCTFCANVKEYIFKSYPPGIECHEFQLLKIPLYNDIIKAFAITFEERKLSTLLHLTI